MQLARRDWLKALACVAVPSWSAAGPFLRSPYLQYVQADRASVLWTTLAPMGGSVTISNESGPVATVKASMRTFLPQETGQPTPFYQYRADLSSLTPGTSYTYSVSLDGQPAPTALAPQFRFRTAAPGKFSFLAFGDTGENSEPQRQVIRAMGAEPGVSMAIHTGDLAYPFGSYAQYETAYFAMNAARMASLPLYPTPGNHDYLGDGAAAYLSSLAAPECGVAEEDQGRYYSFDWSDAHFVSLDSNLLPYDQSDRMLAWLARDLAATRKFWKIVYFHHPPYPTGHHREDPFSAIVRQRVLPMLESAGVQFVIGGHEHGYERTFPLRGGEVVGPNNPSTTYVITGGGGAGLQELGFLPQTLKTVSAFHYVRVDVDGPRLTVRALDPDGTELDNFQLAPVPHFTAKGLVNGGDFSPAVAPGSLATLFGFNFALREATSQNEVTLRIDGQPVPLYYASPSQLNFQLPDSLAASARIEVTTANGLASQIVAIAECAPSVISVSVSADRRIIAYVTGLARYVEELSVWLGDEVFPPEGIEVTLQSPGVYRLGFSLPALPSGEHTFRVAARNSISRPKTFTIG